MNASSNEADAKIRQAIDRENPSTVVAFEGVAGKAVFAIAVAFSVFQVWTAAFNPLSSMVVRSVHVGFLLLMTFALFGFRQHGERRSVPWYDWLLGLTGFVLGLYHYVFETELIQRSGDPNTADLVVGAITVALVFEAARRIMGLALPIICGVFIPYALFGRVLPFGLSHRGYDIDQVIDNLFLSTEGIYGTPTFVSATFIFLFILFGAFLERAGMIKLFNDVSLGMVGHAKGGPAKVAVVSSGFMGTINGSGVANVLTTGQFTIPLMMRFGYRPAFAGAVEATASMGGQLMPPVMGAAAFIMAETIGVPFSEVAIAAAIPAILYFGSAFWMVHLEAGKRNLVGLPKDQCPSVMRALSEGWYLILPLAALVYLLFSGFTPLFAGVIGIAATVALILGSRIAGGFAPSVLRVGFWVLLGLVAAGLWRLGLRTEHLAFAIVGLLVVPCLFFRGGRETLALLVQSLADGAKNAVGVGVACALVGVLIGMLTLTGLASSFAGTIVQLSGGNLLLALLLTMLACIVLGTGLPTTANYIITAAIAAPALLQMGVPLIVSHMFVFYFGIMADLTPPVALAALAASSICRASHMQIGLIATRVAMAGYVVPFMAVYDPALMLQTSDPLAVAYILLKACIAIGLWGAATIGFFWTPLNWPERVFAAAGAFLFVLALPLTDEMAFVLTGLFLLWQRHRARSAPVITRPAG
ncbi:TRAP transporter permease [Azospirillum rugosum]|uniref:TRAP transporter 4TM/12TM fusion protein n=1 Tax=Azospirillum rugosum TaxID=416170 RepID=A0ABS4SPU1_9PROT|nr:TRAP transporter permease [Azospirillum rugosum]MBP2294571.1 TRAP transporter 4TM/12TM fusion protein [Azospirillum rugosum]MDQ0524641.1 TRAP transporter 4TM/12TM fusion protein [Azospirillum rugosum]